MVMVMVTECGKCYDCTVYPLLKVISTVKGILVKLPKIMKVMIILLRMVVIVFPRLWR